MDHVYRLAQLLYLLQGTGVTLALTGFGPVVGDHVAEVPDHLLGGSVAHVLGVLLVGVNYPVVLVYYDDLFLEVIEYGKVHPE